MAGIQKEQEILIGCADIIMDAYSMETACLRALKYADQNGDEAASKYIDAATVFCNDAIQRVEATAKNTIAGFAEGDDLRMMLAALKRFTKNNSPKNTIAARRRIADSLIEANTYNF
jgi:hypothetical protein